MRVAELLEDTETRTDPAELEKAVEAIARDCKPFLREFGGQGLLFRGSRSINHGPQRTFSKRGVRAMRRPMNTPEHLHQQMDDWFYGKFRIRARSGAMFATGNFREARGYGTVYCVFPIGHFRFVWSPKVQDLFIDLRPENESDVPGFLESAQYQDTDLAAAIASKGEVMIQCQEYYLLLANTPQDRDDVLRMLNDEIERNS